MLVVICNKAVCSHDTHTYFCNIKTIDKREKKCSSAVIKRSNVERFCFFARKENRKFSPGFFVAKSLVVAQENLFFAQKKLLLTNFWSEAAVAVFFNFQAGTRCQHGFCPQHLSCSLSLSLTHTHTHMNTHEHILLISFSTDELYKLWDANTF